MTETPEQPDSPPLTDRERRQRIIDDARQRHGIPIPACDTPVWPHAPYHYGMGRIKGFV